jgi:hypothetical protein
MAENVRTKNDHKLGDQTITGLTSSPRKQKDGGISTDFFNAKKASADSQR